MAHTRSAWAMLAGFLIAARGVVLYTQLGTLADLRVGLAVLSSAAVASLVATLGGSLTAMLASVMWARKALTGHVLSAALSLGAAGFLLGLVVNINVHGPTAILLFVIPLIAIEAILLFCIFVGREVSSAITISLVDCFGRNSSVS